MQVVIYCRVSSEEQAEKDISIPAQRKAIRKWAESQGYRVLKEFVDEGQSAYAPADKRPGFCDMVSFCRKAGPDMILVHKLDRFSRNREESILFKSLLRKHGVAVKSVTEHYDPETPQGFLYEGMIEVINQFYSMNLAMETLKGMKENAERGFHNGGRIPYAYRLSTVTERGREHRRLTPGPDHEVATVQEMFRMAVEEGVGSKVIARELNRRKIPAPRARGWSGPTVTNVLSNRVYIGDLVWRKRKTMGRTGRQKVDEKDWIVAEGVHEPLIDRDIFEKRAELAAGRRFNVPRAKANFVQFLLGRLITCGQCGSNYVGRRQRYKTRRGEVNYRSHYYCNDYLTKGAEICPSLPIEEAWADDVVYKLIRARLCEPEALKELERRVKARILERQKALGNAPELVAQKLREIDGQIANFYKAIGEGLDPLICRRHIAELTERKTRLEAEAEAIEGENYFKYAMENCIEELRGFSKAFVSGFEKLPLGVRRQVVLYFIDKIEVVDREIFAVSLRIPVDGRGVKLLTEEIEKSKNGQGADNGDSGMDSASVFTSGKERGAILDERKNFGEPRFFLFSFVPRQLRKLCSEELPLVLL